MSKGPVRCNLVDAIFAKHDQLEAWFAQEAARYPAPPYTSIDLRDSCFKVAPVDSNIFPAGFNNICTDDWTLAAKAFTRVLTAKGLPPKRILIIPENNTSNLFYFNNLWALREILTLGGFDVTLGHINPALAPTHPDGATAFTAENGRTILLERAFREGSVLRTERTAFTSDDLVLLNNDLSNGIPRELVGLTQDIAPHPSMGWHRRLKSEHLKNYRDLTHDFAKIIDCDPWCIAAEFSSVDNINFDSGEGIETLAEEVDKLLRRIAGQYKERGIDYDPFVFIKHNSGTYGRSIMHVKSAKEVLDMNRREKNKMNISKGGVQVSSVVLMEGIPTFLKEDDQTAEPVIYLAGHEPIGGFLRINPNRDAEGNLNSAGAHFKPLCFANLFRNQSRESIMLEKVYGALGRLSALANGREMQ
jgi:glutamate--cysteine ligase